MLNIKIVRVLILLVIAFHSSNAISAGNTILSNQNFSQLGNDGRLVIQFYSPMGYVSHFPAKKGNTLKLRMKELFPNPQNISALSEQLVVPKIKTNPVEEINYEQEVRQTGILTIRFNRTVNFEIKMSRDRKSLAITLKNIKTEDRQAAKPPSVSTGLPIYSLNLKSSSSPIDVKNQAALRKYGKYDIYVTETTTKWKTVYTLHVGYFYSPSAAKANLKVLKAFYPQGWVGKIKPDRRDTAQAWFYKQKLARIKKRPKTGKPEKLDILIERGRQAMLDKNYKQAIRLFTRILQLATGDDKKEAKELLGVAREHNGQFAHAKAEYKEYLKLYPEGEDAERVKQRLLGLLTARSRAKDKLKQKVARGVEPKWDFFGSMFQFYRNQRIATDTTDSIETDSSLSTDILLAGRKRGLDYNQRFNVSASHRYDFLATTDNSDGRVSTFYYEISKRDDNYGGRIGRQTHSSDGVLGRFDGIILNKRIGTDKKINFLAGYPVELSTTDGVDTDRQFYALSFDFDALYLDTDFKFYYIQQDNEGFTDRNAVGVQLKYIDESSSYFATIDYDVFFSELSQATVIANWRNKANSSLTVVADHRRSPLLTTNNALIGQTVTNLTDLRLTFTEDQIYQLAKDRSSTYDAITVSASTFLSERYQLNGDITFSSLDGTVASGGVAATQGTGTESFYNVGLVINNFFTDNDITIFGARYSDASTSDVIQLNFSSNFNLNRKWRVNPRLVLDSRDNASGSSRTTIKPRILVHYRPSRTFKYEFDMGYEDAETEGTFTTSETSLYVFFGYIYDF